MVEFIICRACNSEKPKFHGRECKDCNNARHRGYYYARTEEQRQTRRNYNNALQRPFNRARWLKSNYGMTEADYDAMLKAQNGLCGICKTDDPKGKWNRFHVDHCHATGKIRGLLCNKCNIALGSLGDTLERANAMIQYLSVHRSPP